MTIIQNAGTGEVSLGFYSGVATQSLRFEDGDSAKLAITPGSASNRRTFTFSSWVKRSTITADGALFACGANAQNRTQIYFLSNDKLGVYSNASNSDVIYAYTDAVFRDVSAWYNVVVAIDTTDGTAGNRLKMYVNGVEQSYTYDTTPSQNDDLNINNNVAHAIGSDAYAAQNLFDGYLAEVNFIDGTALTAASFGETKDGIWIPKSTSGLTFGTQGFRLEFKQTGTGTASTSTIGADTSGQTNHLTSTNLAATDSNMPDCPENNFATLNPLVVRAGAPTLSEGNLKLVGSGTDYDRSYATIGLTSGKWYAEFLYVSGDNRGMFGVVREDARASDASDIYIGSILNTFGIDFRARAYTGTGSSSDGQELFDGTNFDTGDIGLLCFDIDNGKLWFGRRDVSGSSTIWYDSSGNNNGDPSAGSNPTYTGTYTGHTWFIGCHDYNGTTIITNFGQDGSFAGALTSQGVSDANGIGDFNYIESGFLALCTSNLPDVTIGPGQTTQADDHFNTVLWTGNGSDGRSITGVGFDPDWVWIKSRNLTTSHLLNDTVRGANKSLFSEANTAETANNGGGYLSAFVTDGFSVTSGSSGDDAVNDGSDTYVAWNWLAGTAFSNDASATSVGNIDSSGQVNTTAGFAILSYTGTGSTTTFAHGLGVQPEYIIIKNRDAARGWFVLSKEYQEKYLSLEGSGSEQGGYYASGQTFDDRMTTSIITVDQSTTEVNTDGEKYICYAFAPVEGYSKFGFYTGNNNSNGPFIYTGFRPAWVMFKGTTVASNWCILDNKRSPLNLSDDVIQANENNAEATNLSDIDFLSNGIKIRDVVGNDTNKSHTYVYFAFAESPFKFANAR